MPVFSWRSWIVLINSRSSIVNKTWDKFPFIQENLSGNNGNISTMHSDLHLSRNVRKPDFCICENKDAYQLCSKHKTDQRLCFRYMDSTIPLLPKSENFEPLAIFCDFPARFVSDLLGNPKDWFSDVAAHLTVGVSLYRKVLNFWAPKIFAVGYLKFK